MSNESRLREIRFLEDLLKSAPEADTIGGYRVEGIITADATKAILQSRDPLTDRPIRLVIFPRSAVAIDAARAKLLPGHDFLYPVHDLIDLNGHPALILPEPAGESLGQKLKSGRKLEPAIALRITRELMAALAVGRDRGLAHGWITPETVFIESSGSGQARLMGLGWRILEPAGAGDLAGFMASGGGYTPAPEVAEGGPTDERSDIFGVGCLLYQMLTGKAPFPGDSPLAIIRSLALVETEPASKAVPGISPRIDALLASLMAKKPADRPATAREAAGLVKEAETALKQEPAAAAPYVPDIPIIPDEDEIGLVPLEPEFTTPVATPKAATPPASPKTAPVATMPATGDEDDLLIDFAEPIGSGVKTGSPVPDDDMLIDLMPIDDTPAAKPQATSPSAAKQARKAQAAAGTKPGAGWQTMKTPLEWVFIADSPVEAVHLAGEAQRILVRDQTGRLLVMTTAGEILASEKTPEPIRLSATDQAGQLVALILGKNSLVLVDWDLNLLAERTLHSEPVAIAVDALGLYVAVSFPGNETRLYSRAGKPAGSFESRQPLAHMAFVPGTARLIGSTKFDQLVCAEMEQAGGHKLDADVIWTQNTGVAFGNLHMIGGAGKLLASCHNMGLQRLNLDGENEGTYQLGGTVIEAAADYPGRFFLASTLEGSLLAVNANGSVIWEHTAGGPWRHLCVDPLGRFGLAASAMGEVVMIDLTNEPRGKVDNSKAKTITTGGDSGSSSVKTAEWSLRVADEHENTTGYSLCVSDRPWRACLLDNKKKLTCFVQDGDEAESLAALGGSGRMLKTRDGWVAVANHRTIVLVNLSSSEIMQPDLSMVQITHFEMRPAQYGLLIIQEGDRIGRATPAGRWVWRVQLPATAESLALANDGYTALSLDNGHMIVLDAAGKGVGKWSAGEQEAVLVCESQARHEGRCRWISLARQERVIRGHALDTRVLWQAETPFAPWELVRTGQGVVVAANNGEAVMYDDSGKLVATRRAKPGTIFASGADGSAIALHTEAGQVFCTRFDGTVLWRVPIDGELKASALTQTGALLLTGGVLSWVMH